MRTIRIVFVAFWVIVALIALRAAVGTIDDKVEREEPAGVVSDS